VIGRDSACFELELDPRLALPLLLRGGVSAHRLLISLVIEVHPTEPAAVNPCRTVVDGANGGVKSVASHENAWYESQGMNR